MTISKQVGEAALIYRREKIWWVNLQVWGSQIRRSLKTRNEKEARRLAVEYERDVSNASSKHPDVQRDPVTVREASEGLLTNAEAEERAAKTLTKYRGVLERLCQIVEAAGKSSLMHLDLEFIDDYRLRRRPQEASPKTIYNEVVLLRQLVNFAVKRRLVPHDPLAGLKVREPKPTPQPCWTSDEVEQILAAAKDPQKFVFTLLAETGARIGELKWLTGTMWIWSGTFSTFDRRRDGQPRRETSGPSPSLSGIAG